MMISSPFCLFICVGTQGKKKACRFLTNSLHNLKHTLSSDTTAIFPKVYKVTGETKLATWLPRGTPHVAPHGAGGGGGGGGGGIANKKAIGEKRHYVRGASPFTLSFFIIGGNICGQANREVRPCFMLSYAVHLVATSSIPGAKMPVWQHLGVIASGFSTYYCRMRRANSLKIELLVFSFSISAYYARLCVSYCGSTAPLLQSHEACGWLSFYICCHWVHPEVFCRATLQFCAL